VPEDVADDILDSLAHRCATSIGTRIASSRPCARDSPITSGTDCARADLGGERTNEVLQHLLQAFGGPGRTAFGFGPTYSMYPLLTRATGASYVAGTRGVDFTITPEDAATQIEEAKPDVTFLCSPNNPTGTRSASM
jgi:histidinol-phosphate aminotransferase